MENTLDKTVSVVIPCYNYAKYLEECVDSVVNQSYKALEIIIVDDGSPDNTIEVAHKLIQKYPNETIKYLAKHNGGLSSARNAGIKLAGGEYVMCLDADDKLVPEAIQRHMELIDNDMCIAQCGLMEFGERHIMYAPNETNLKRILLSNTIFCNAVFSKKLWNQIGGYDESEIMRMGREDHEFWVRCLEAGARVRVSDFIALRYRVHGNNMTKMTLHPNWAKIEEYFHVKHEHLYREFGIMDTWKNNALSADS